MKLVRIMAPVAVEAALDCVLGYCGGNDASDRIVLRHESKFGCLLAGKGASW